MTKIYFVDYCDKGEAEGFYSEDGELLGCWDGNDGTWRGEYFDGFLEALGIEVDYSGKFNKEFAKEVESDG